MRARLLGIVGAAAFAVAACGSQIAGLAPVSGDGITSVRIAAIDVLLEQNVDIRVAPKCTTEGDTYSCSGKTMDGADITVSAPTTKPLTMTVSVGGSVIYDGSVMDVLDEAAQVNP